MWVDNAHGHQLTIVKIDVAIQKKIEMLPLNIVH
jgi:hypothetical protein